MGTALIVYQEPFVTFYEEFVNAGDGWFMRVVSKDGRVVRDWTFTPYEFFQPKG